VLRRRHPPDVRRALIVETARACIARRGLARTTVREIAQSCGLSTGTITYHFSSMDELLAEVLRAASTAFAEAIVAEAGKHGSALERLFALVDAALPDHPESLELWRLWLDYWARAARDPELATVHHERYRVWRGAVERLIAEGIGTGEFRPVDPEVAATEVVGLFDGLGLQATIGDRTMSTGRARGILRSALETRLVQKTP
jgi:AcrR family transcriptional regulator